VRRAGFDAFSKAIIQHESGGRYGVLNAEGSGAAGIGQIMPDTARSLSQRLGIPYRQDLLEGTSSEARQYQDTLTREALGEAWRYGKGDPRRAAYYYFAGPNQSGWGPKTRRYGEDILRRMGGR
jgi:soluble lytic murein transglycosylase-like protein